MKVLGDSEGTLVVDGYSGYNTVTTPDRRKRAGCNCHARRKLVEAEAQAREPIQWLLEQFRELYEIERKVKEAGQVGTVEHLEIRRTQSRPIMDRIRQWVLQQKSRARPKSEYGKALAYFENQWKALTVFLDDAAVPPDNNLAERLLRRIALARRTCIFVGYELSGQRYAINLSFVASCRLNGINPVEYLTDVLPRIAEYPAKRLDELLPDRWSPVAS